MHETEFKLMKLINRHRCTKWAFVLCLSWLFSFFYFEVAMAENYSTERISKITNEVTKGFSRKSLELGESGFSFNTIFEDKMDIWIDPDVMKKGIIARVYEPENRDKMMIEVHRLQFPSFADAQVAGYGFLALNGYNRVLQDKEHGNSVFGLVAGAISDEAGGYTRMARAAAISHGRDVLVIYATFDYDDYPAYEEALARFFGGIVMEDESPARESLEEQTAKGGETFLFPREWQSKQVDSSGKPEGTSDYNLSGTEEEYPNLVVHIRPVDLEKGKGVAQKMIAAFTKQVDENPQVSFAGEAEMQTTKSVSGSAMGHSYARGWDTTSGGHFVSEIYVQKNADAASVSVLGLNTYDVRRGISSFDRDAQQLIFEGWVTGVSAYSAAKLSLGQKSEDVKREFDLRAIGR